MSDQVQTEVGVYEDRVGGAGRPAGQGPNAGQELFERERLTQVVVRPGIQAADAVWYGISGGQKQDRRGLAGRAETLEQCQSVGARQPPVQEDDVPRAAAEGVPARVAVRRTLHRVVFFAEPADDEIGDTVVVLH